MYYVYLLRSESSPEQRYVGFSADLKARLKVHNIGGSPHTRKYMPWSVAGYVAFRDKQRALDFERYLKSHSGMAFAAKHLW